VEEGNGPPGRAHFRPHAARRLRTQYLDKTPVSSVTVSGVSPGPEQPLNRQLTSTAPQLLDEMIKLVKDQL
jgi:hypothetical protein